MDSFTMANKKVWPVYVLVPRDGKKVYLREQYNVVQFGNDPNALSFIEGLPMPSLRMAVEGFSGKELEDFTDDIKVYDDPPFNTRLGHRMIRV